jgi:hypothetical protein
VSSPVGPTRSRAAGFSKHLEGWQLALVTIAMAWIAVLVMVPRTVLPEEVPLPRLAPKDVAEARARALAESSRIHGEEPSENLRLLASRLRAHGLAEHGGDRRRIADAAAATEQVGVRVLGAEPERVLELRAHLTERFVAAFFEFLRTGVESEELSGLGGNVVQTFRNNGWLDDTDGPEFDLVLRALYRRRFNGLVLPGATLPVDAIEERARVRFLIAHPPTPPVEDPDGLFAGQFILGQIDDAAKLDPAYPAHYARGIALFRVGRYEASAAAFDAFLTEAEDGPYRLRATNYLKAALEHAGGGL